MQLARVEDVRADDQIVRGLVGPRGPVGGALLERDAVAFGVALGEVERERLTIGLHDVRAARGGDCAGEAGASAELEYALAGEIAFGELVCERER